MMRCGLLCVLAFISAMFFVAAAFTAVTVLDAALDTRTTPLGAYMVGLLAPTVAAVVSAWKAAQVGRKVDKASEEVQEMHETVKNGNHTE